MPVELGEEEGAAAGGKARLSAAGWFEAAGDVAAPLDALLKALRSQVEAGGTTLPLPAVSLMVSGGVARSSRLRAALAAAAARHFGATEEEEAAVAGAGAADEAAQGAAVLAAHALQPAAVPAPLDPHPHPNPRPTPNP